MVDGEKVLALVPARGGSKGIPYKNLQKIKNRSLIEWTFLSAKKVPFIDTLVLSTEDSKIADEAQRIGYEILHRPLELAGDNSPTMDCVLHALEFFPNYQWLLLLQPTSPLRTHQDIQSAIELCIQKKALSCVSVCSVQHHPHFIVSLEDSFLRPAFSDLHAKRRQDLPSLYAINGAIYFAKSAWLRKVKTFIHRETPTQAYIMPQSRSLDIDTFEDLYFAEFLLSNPFKGKDNLNNL